MFYPEVALAFQLVVYAYGNLHMCRVKGPLVLVRHTLSCYQDATLAEQSPAAGQVPERRLLWDLPLVSCARSMGCAGAADSAIGRWADIDGCMPWPLSVREVVRTESVKFATNCWGGGQRGEIMSETVISLQTGQRFWLKTVSTKVFLNKFLSS